MCEELFEVVWIWSRLFSDLEILSQWIFLTWLALSSVFDDFQTQLSIYTYCSLLISYYMV